MYPYVGAPDASMRPSPKTAIIVNFSIVGLIGFPTANSSDLSSHNVSAKEVEQLSKVIMDAMPDAFPIRCGIF